MASISTDANNNRTIQFKRADRKRKIIYLGHLPMKTVEAIKTKVEALNAADIAKLPIDFKTAEWLQQIDCWLYDKLAAVGLVEQRVDKKEQAIGKFIDDYLIKRTDIKPGTMTNLKQARRWLVGFFGEEKSLADVNVADADEFRIHLNEHIGENTLRRMCKRARQFFQVAVRKKLIPTNPFGEMKGLSSQGHPERYHFVTKEVANKVLDACPDPEWRLIFALSRFGGLRCPSEHLALCWSDVDWDHSKLMIRSPKTEHHAGKERRIIPLFPELKPLLEAAYATAGGAEYVINRYRSTNVNLRTQLLRIIAKAGVSPWPKLFQNLRSTRETELAEIFPVHVVCQWLGNSETVAKKHYLQVTDSHYERAVGAICPPLHIPMQKGAATGGNHCKGKNASSTHDEAFQEVSTAFKAVQLCTVTLGRFEPPF